MLSKAESINKVIRYTSQLTGIKPEQLKGFMSGWRKPLTLEQHLQVLKNSYRVFLAIDEDTNQVVGFVNALSDGIQAAFIPLLEVLPAYQGKGIGTELMRLMLAELKHIISIDLTCNPETQAFYKRVGMIPSVGMIVRNF
jgi:ribosomal protein S18 acetylase RimI-like enzyme